MKRTPLLLLLALPALLGAPLGCRPPESPLTPVLTEIPSAVSGLRFRFTLPQPRPCNILGTIGNGVAFLDYDGDGNLDALLVARRPGLFRGDGHGKFVDVTSSVLGIHEGRFLGCAVGDYDNDGFSDIYLSGFGEGKLLHNEAGRRFNDVSRAAGVGPQPWGSSAAFVDLDQDGQVDLVVGNYIEFSPRHRQYCAQGGVNLACSPSDYFQVKPTVYRNRGGIFESMKSLWDVSERTNGKTLGVAAADMDQSGTPSVYLANDQTVGDLLRFSGDRLTNDAVEAGVGYALSGAKQAGMGVDWGDYDNDGWLDLAVATYAGEVKPIYHNQGDRLFEEQSANLGVAAPLMPYISFGVKWLDIDNDGWLDLLYTNGHVADNIQEYQKDQRFRQSSVLLQNVPVTRGRRFESVTLPSLSRPIVGRGIAAGDYDNDGRVDLLIADSDGEPLLLHNESQGGHWLSVRLIGGSRSGRDAYGAVVTVEGEGRKITRHCHADGSYLSSSDARLHFGLGRMARVSRLTVRWPSGSTTTAANPGIDRFLTVEER